MQSETRVESPSEIFRRVFREFRPRTPLAGVEVEYREYAGATSLIEFRESCLRIRLSDLFAPAPPAVIEALAHILVARLLRKQPAGGSLARLRRFLNGKEMIRKAEQIRRVRGHKRLASPQGRNYDLIQIFEDLNFRFFHGLMARPAIGWSRSASRSVVGHYDPAHHAIVISRLLDQPAVPRLVVEYVMFHEMLHLRYPTTVRGARRCIHGEEFRRAEQQFPELTLAKELLTGICRQAARPSRPRARRPR